MSEPDQDLIKIDIDHRIITIHGIRYSMEIFAHLGLGELGSWIRIVRREDGVVTCERAPVGEAPPEDDAQQDPGYGN